MAEQQANDTKFMAMALEAARNGLGTTSPNPAVGAVIVAGDHSGRVLAECWTQPGGRPHAETEAIAAAGPEVAGACLYVTLEPCAHTGKTPPCADAIIAGGIDRAVVAVRDWDERVAGRGIARLRAAGIAVVEGVARAEALWINAGHFLRTAMSRPFVQLKLAVSGDGLVAPGDGSPVWVTGEQARRHGHVLRAETDAILVGRGTIVADNPVLNCRLPDLGWRSPIRIVLDSQLSLSPDCRVFDNMDGIGAIVFCASEPEASKHKLLADQGTDVEAVPLLESECGSRGLDLSKVLYRLADRGVTRLLVEGGATVARSFLSQGLVDEICLFRGATTLGSAGIRPLGDGELMQEIADHGFVQSSSRMIDADCFTVFRNSQTIARLETGGRSGGKGA